MQSPLKGLERLTEELRLERQKAGEALQDVTRLRVEIASLKQSNDEKDAIISEYDENHSLEQAEYESLQAAYEELQSEYANLREFTLSHEEDYNNYSNERTELHNIIDDLKASHHETELEMAALKAKCNGLEGRANGKEELINKLKRELQDVRNNLTESEQDRMNTHEALRQQETWNEELKLELGKFDVMNDGYQQTKSSNDELRSELNAALSANAAYLDQIRELSLKIKDKSGNESSLEKEIRELREQHELTLKELHDLETNRNQLSAQVRAEMDASEAAKERAQSAARGREFLDRQLHELQEKHGQVLRYNASLEEELTQEKSTSAELRTEVSALREKLVQSQGVVEQASGMQAMVMEMDLLRSQLNDVRRQLLRRDVEDEAGVMAPQAIAIREEQCRSMYEGIISQLRIDIEQTNTRYHETSRRCEEALRLAHQVPALKEEIEMYKEISRHSSQESQSVALSVSEEKNRALKVTQEKNNLLHELHRTEAELVSAKAEIKRANEEITAQREKVKTFHANKIAADKKVAESSTINSRLETSLEEAKQKADAISLELEKTKRMVHEQSFTISDLRIKISEVDNLRADSAALSSKLVALKAEFHTREKDLTLQVETLRHQKATVERELVATREKISIHRNGFEQSHVDLARLRAELDAVIVERDRLKRNLVVNENQQAEQHLFELKRDLEQTVHEFNDLEKEKSVKDKIIQQITAECSKEREKVTLLKLQMSTLEDRLRVANQELSVYRGIDVYHSSMQVQLQSYRKDRSFNDSVLEQSVNKSRFAPASESRANTTERDLGSAFANSVGADATATPRVPSRPSSRTSNANSVRSVQSVTYAEESERDNRSGRSSRSQSPVQFITRITNPIHRVDLNKPSSPVLRPAPIPTPSTTDRFSHQAASSRTLSSSSNLNRPQVPDAVPVSTGKFSLHEMDAHDESQDELEVKSVISDLASHHSQYSHRGRQPDQDEFVRHEEEQYLPTSDRESGSYHGGRPVASRSASAPRGGRAPQTVSSEFKYEAPPLPQDPPSDREDERQELLRRRAERKALRDQQLRDRILRDGTLATSFSALRGSETKTTEASARSSSAMRSTSSAPRNERETNRDNRPTHSTRDPAAPSTRDNLSMSLGARRTASAHTTNPVRAGYGGGSSNLNATTGGVSAGSYSGRGTSSSVTPATTAAPSVREVAAYRPAKTDFERARKLLSM